MGVGRGGFELRASNQPKALHLIGLDFWVWGRGGGGGAERGGYIFVCVCGGGGVEGGGYIFVGGQGGLRLHFVGRGVMGVLWGWGVGG